MRFRHPVLAAWIGLAAGPAIAQSAGEAFECKLPYRASLESAATLPVARQSVKPQSAFFGAETLVEFTPGQTRIAGQAPLALSLQMTEPKAGSGDPVAVTLGASFSRTAQIEQALTAAVSAVTNCPATLKSCAKNPKVAGEGLWEYSRHDPATLRLTCRFFIKEKDVPN